MTSTTSTPKAISLPALQPSIEGDSSLAMPRAATRRLTMGQAVDGGEVVGIETMPQAQQEDH